MSNQISTTSSEVSQKEQNQIILYRPNDTISLEVRLENETVWLTQAQMAELFQKDQSVIARHIKNVFTEKELETESNMQILHNTISKFRPTAVYSLDVVISVGYRVKSIRGTQFRQWANKVLKEYLLRGYAINQRINLLEDKIDRKFSEQDAKIENLNKQVDFFVRTSLPPTEGIFHNGQIFDAHNKQYPPIEIFMHTTSHDRFLIIDDAEVYHIGASLKDLGKKLFAFSKLNIPPSAIL